MKYAIKIGIICSLAALLISGCDNLDKKPIKSATPPTETPSTDTENPSNPS